jgi:hypothetical protein
MDLYVKKLDLHIHFFLPLIESGYYTSYIRIVELEFHYDFIERIT